MKKKKQWVQLRVLTKTVRENIFSTIENRVLRLGNGEGTWNNQGLEVTTEHWYRPV